MKLKKWENPNLTSLNVEATETCPYHSPDYWHCPQCNEGVVSPVVKPGPTYHCPKLGCDAELIDVGCGPHPS
ncbi:hypothetical protein QYB59_000850 [Clostridium perfringens]|nr:hypothetical protein [Clostridium perfringens]